MKTYAPKPRDIERRWYVVDADGVVLGRLASEVAQILRGKHKPIFAPHADTGDHVIVVNARRIRLTGNKAEQKHLYRHSGYPGGLTEIPYARILAQRPTLAVEKAIKGMLPKNRLGRAMARKLQVYEGPEHPHAAQKPVALALGAVPSWDGLPAPPQPPAAAPKKEPKARGDTAATTKTTARIAAKSAKGAKSAKSAKSAKTTKTTKKSTSRTSAKKSTSRTSTSGSTAKRGSSARSGTKTESSTKTGRSSRKTEKE